MRDLISRQAAIDAFYNHPNIYWTTLDVLAKIDALPSAQPDHPMVDIAKVTMAMAKKADMVAVTRCKDCRFQDKGRNESESWNLCGYRPWLHVPTEDEHYCGYAERRTDGTEDADWS